MFPLFELVESCYTSGPAPAGPAPRRATQPQNKYAALNEQAGPTRHDPRATLRQRALTYG